MLVADKLSKSFSRGLFKQPAPVVTEASFAIKPGEALGLVGQSGSGKSTIARLLVRLFRPTGGRVVYRGTDLTALSEKEYRPYRCKLQIIFQHPSLTLSPKKTILDTLLEPMLVHKLVSSRHQAMDKVAELLNLTNLQEEVLDRYPHQISGGQAQRVVIARALSLEPEVIIADEPTSMLDLSVQAQILDLLKTIQTSKQTAILLISHDIPVVRAFCDRVAFLADGKIMSVGNPVEVLGNRRINLLPGKNRDIGGGPCYEAV